MAELEYKTRSKPLEHGSKNSERLLQTPSMPKRNRVPSKAGQRLKMSPSSIPDHLMNQAMPSMNESLLQSKKTPLQMKTANKTGLPDKLKAGVENLSGYAMDNVRVHYNSDKPSQVGALAYTQGTDIYVAPGQERHLPHEAWHVVQQAQGMVTPTMQLKGIGINTDTGLEYEADKMGARAQNYTGSTDQSETMNYAEISRHDTTTVAQCFRNNSLLEYEFIGYVNSIPIDPFSFYPIRSYIVKIERLLGQYKEMQNQELDFAEYIPGVRKYNVYQRAIQLLGDIIRETTLARNCSSKQPYEETQLQLDSILSCANEDRQYYLSFTNYVRQNGFPGNEAVSSYILRAGYLPSGMVSQKNITALYSLGLIDFSFDYWFKMKGMGGRLCAQLIVINTQTGTPLPTDIAPYLVVHLEWPTFADPYTMDDVNYIHLKYSTGYPISDAQGAFPKGQSPFSVLYMIAMRQWNQAYLPQLAYKRQCP